MPLLPVTLQTGLMAMTPTLVDAQAAQAFAQAWSNYFGLASVFGIPAIPGSYQAGITAMTAQLLGFSVQNVGAAKITAALTTFWTTIGPMGPAIWLLPPPAIVLPIPIVPPPGIASVAAALAGIWAGMSANPTGTIVQAAQQMSTALHASAGLGAIATVQVTAVPVPVITPFPIL